MMTPARRPRCHRDENGRASDVVLAIGLLAEGRDLVGAALDRSGKFGVGSGRFANRAILLFEAASWR